MPDSALTRAEGSGGPVSSGDKVRSALASTDIPATRLIVHVTGARRWLEASYRPTPSPGLRDDRTAGLLPQVQRGNPLLDGGLRVAPR